MAFRPLIKEPILIALRESAITAQWSVNPLDLDDMDVGQDSICCLAYVNLSLMKGHMALWIPGYQSQRRPCVYQPLNGLGILFSPVHTYGRN